MRFRITSRRSEAKVGIRIVKVKSDANLNPQFKDGKFRAGLEEKRLSLEGAGAAGLERSESCCLSGDGRRRQTAGKSGGRNGLMISLGPPHGATRTLCSPFLTRLGATYMYLCTTCGPRPCWTPICAQFKDPVDM